jgi:glutamyl-tRNA synthetase
MSDSVRVRFAPSPTGYLHVGGLRTALYNYLFARKHGGTFVLRIEDTDRSRYVPGAVEQLIESLRWTGLAYDEGPDVGGPHGPYYQSERLGLYRAAVDRLRAEGLAYPCFCTSERLEEMRRSQMAAKQDPKYDRACLNLPPEEVLARLQSGTPHVIRMLVPETETIVIDDLVRGEVRIAASQLDDQVLLKSDGFPTYHLANVVDDHEMGITHVIRGEEWLSSTPKHVLLYRFLGFELPRFAHLPLLLNPDKSKLSKRQGDVAVEDYRAQDYFPEALVNFVAFLGWNPGDDRELFSLDELVEAFSLERVGKSGAVFNLEKLRWFNQEYLRRRPPQELVPKLRPLVEEQGWAGFSDEYLARAIELMKDRLAFVREYPQLASWLFTDPKQYDADTARKRWKEDSPGLLREFLPELSGLEPFTEERIQETLESFVSRRERKAGELIHPLRLACTGIGKGPGLYELLAALGKETVVRRIELALDALS